MRSQASWEEQQQAIEAAKVLAEFANLEPGDETQFQANHPEFVPQAWWEYPPTDPRGNPLPKKQWQIAQKFVRDAWLFEFQLPLFDYVHLLTAVFNPENIEWSKLSERHRPAFATGLDLEDEYPYHLAAKWLSGNGWRAKTCWWCKRRFIAEHSRARFCRFGTTVDGNETTCFWAHRKPDQRKNWEANKKRVNKKRRREYRANEQKERHAKRKSLHKR